MRELTVRQEEILAFIRATIARDGSAPTNREMAAHFGMRSVNSIHDHLKLLRKKGALSWVPKKSRGIRLKIIIPAEEAVAEKIAAWIEQLKSPGERLWLAQEIRRGAWR